MLILAGVAISMAIGDEGVIENTEKALVQNERAQVQEIIISSYVFKPTASTTNSYLYLDMEKTAEAIYDNLTANKFKLKNGTEDYSKTEFLSQVNATTTNLNIVVEGKHAEYQGTLNEKGLESDIQIVDTENGESSGSEDDTGSGENGLDNEVIIPTGKFYSRSSGKGVCFDENGKAIEFVEGESGVDADGNLIFTLHNLKIISDEGNYFDNTYSFFVDYAGSYKEELGIVEYKFTYIGLGTEDGPGGSEYDETYGYFKWFSLNGEKCSYLDRYGLLGQCGW